MGAPTIFYQEKIEKWTGWTGWTTLYKDYIKNDIVLKKYKNNI